LAADLACLRGLGAVFLHCWCFPHAANALTISTAIAALAKVFVIIDPLLERDGWCADLTSKHPV
jgi:hypothetical protein